jgi:hypothetical protein
MRARLGSCGALIGAAIASVGPEAVGPAAGPSSPAWSEQGGRRMSMSATKLTRKEGPRHEALPAPTVMTRSIEPPRKRGPFDPRWLTGRPVKELGRLAEAPPEAIPWPALEAWEGEWGAPRAEARPTNRKTRARQSAARSGVLALSLLPRDRDSREPEVVLAGQPQGFRPPRSPESHARHEPDLLRTRGRL